MRFRRLFSRESSEKGGATLELAIIAPTFILFIVGMVDLGRILMHHLVLTQIAYEGVRLASTTAALEPTPVPSPVQRCTLTSTYEPGMTMNAQGPCNGFAPNHQQVHTRVRTLFTIHSQEADLQLVEDGARGRSTTIATTYPFGPGNADIQCRICAFYDGLFPVFYSQIRICAEAVGPYLEN